jgi:ketosteroid isomerase-like protein
MTGVRIAILPLLWLGAAVFCAPHRAGAAGDSISREVAAVLEAQQQAWNRGDIVGFMNGYAQGEGTTFVSGDTITRGWQTVLQRYQARYSDREKMGTLAFTEVEITPVCDDVAIAIGKWALKVGSTNPHGRFTLIFRRTAQGWRIVHDHTSSADK